MRRMIRSAKCTMVKAHAILEMATLTKDTSYTVSSMARMENLSGPMALNIKASFRTTKSLGTASTLGPMIQPMRAK
jgi:hypothetical protein